MVRIKKVGVFGGAFDPIHRGHLELARTCIKFLSLDNIRFVPAQQSLLKQPCVAKPWQRAAMVALAIVNEPKFFLDTRELTREEPSYALLTLQSLHQEFPSTNFYWLLGEDAFQHFTHWYRWQEIAALCDLVVVSRKLSKPQSEALYQEVETCFQQHDHQVVYIQMPCVNVASQDIRTDLVHLSEVPELVQRYILESQVYSAAE